MGSGQHGSGGCQHYRGGRGTGDVNLCVRLTDPLLPRSPVGSSLENVLAKVHLLDTKSEQRNESSEAFRLFMQKENNFYC